MDRSVRSITLTFRAYLTKCEEITSLAPVYFDTSVFLAIFNREPTGPEIRRLLRELKRDRMRIYTSIVSVQEASVLGFRRGRAADDNHAEINRLARIQSITKQIALTAAKFEAVLVDGLVSSGLDERERHADNKRRKWDCFHVATAVVLRCRTLYTCDKKLLPRKDQLGLTMDFSEPSPRNPELPFTESPSIRL